MKFDDVKKLHQKKYRNEFQHYLVEGEHLIIELQKALRARGQNKHNISLYVSHEHLAWSEQFSSDFSVVELSSKQMKQLSETKSPQGIIACVPTSLHEGIRVQDDNKLKSIYLYEVQDPGNLGTILRTAAWFGGFKIMLSPNCVDPFNAKVIRSGMGAGFHVAVECDVSLTQLNERFDRFAYLDMKGKAISESYFSDFPCYLFGNEARGVPNEAIQNMAAEAFTIAGCGAIDSLNLGSAVTICAHRLASGA